MQGNQPKEISVMIAHHTATAIITATEINTVTTITAIAAPAAATTIRSEAECQARASEFLTELIGSPPEDLLWDDRHHLQGHGHLYGHEVVVIAPRDDDHRTVVLTVEDWDAVRLADSQQRRHLLSTCAIADRNRLAEVLRSELSLAA
jgi:hypothetical protein